MNKVQSKAKATTKRVRCILLFTLFSFNLSLAFAQTAERIDALFNTPELSYEQAAAFVLEASDIAVRSEQVEVRSEQVAKR